MLHTITSLMKRANIIIGTTLVFLYSILLGVTANAQNCGVGANQCSEIFISEYYSGEKYNDAIEVYNPSGAVINLQRYFLVITFLHILSI